MMGIYEEEERNTRKVRGQERSEEDGGKESREREQTEEEGIKRKKAPVREP